MVYLTLRASYKDRAELISAFVFPFCYFGKGLSFKIEFLKSWHLLNCLYFSFKDSSLACVLSPLLSRL